MHDNQRDNLFSQKNEPCDEPIYNLDDLLKQCTPEKRHESIEFGIVGKELI